MFQMQTLVVNALRRPADFAGDTERLTRVNRAVEIQAEREDLGAVGLAAGQLHR